MVNDSKALFNLEKLNAFSFCWSSTLVFLLLYLYVVRWVRFLFFYTCSYFAAFLLPLLLGALLSPDINIWGEPMMIMMLF